MEEQVEQVERTGWLSLEAGRGCTTDPSVHVTAGEGGAPDTSMHVTAGFGSAKSAPKPISQGARALSDTEWDAHGETKYQRALAKLVPGTKEFDALVKARRAGKQYRQPIMFWASNRGRRRG